MNAVSWVRLYWNQNEDWLKNYYPDFKHFAGQAGVYVKNYNLKVNINIPGFEEIVKKRKLFLGPENK